VQVAAYLAEPHRMLGVQLPTVSSEIFTTVSCMPNLSVNLFARPVDTAPVPAAAAPTLTQHHSASSQLLPGVRLSAASIISPTAFAASCLPNLNPFADTTVTLIQCQFASSQLSAGVHVAAASSVSPIVSAASSNRKANLTRFPSAAPVPSVKPQRRTKQKKVSKAAQTMASEANAAKLEQIVRRASAEQYQLLWSKHKKQLKATRTMSTDGNHQTTTD
jgi:hypothetical protein